MKLKKLKNIPVVISLHKNYLDIISNQYTNRSTKHIKAFIKKLNQFDEIFVPSPYVAQDLRKYGLESKVSYMPLASDFESKVDITTLKRNANKEYGLNINDNVFVSVCNLNKFKRLDFALEALAYVKRKGIDFKYYIIGKGKELETLEELTKELHLTNCVEFLGFLEDEQMAKLLARANLMLFPTTSDIFGLCKVESAELETPGMFIKNSYVASDVFNGINGFTSNNTPKDYAQSIMEAIANKKKLKEVGETAKRELFVTWKTCADILKERLINIIKESKIIRKVKK